MIIASDGAADYLRTTLNSLSEEEFNVIGAFTALDSNFKLGGEILKTVEVQSYKEIGLIACIFSLRVAMTLLINYESHHLTKHHDDDAHIKSNNQ